MLITKVQTLDIVSNIQCLDNKNDLKYLEIKLKHLKFFEFVPLIQLVCDAVLKQQ